MKKRAILFTIITLLTAGAQSFAQPRIHEANTAYYVELGGNSVSYSINFDHMIRIKNGYAVAPRLGFSYTPNLMEGVLGIASFPFELNGLIPVSGRSHYFELGPGYTYLLISGRIIMKDHGGIFNVRLGYRYQKTDGGFMFRAGLMRMIRDFGNFSLNKKQALTWAGISCGIAF